ncbi:MAG TPA: tRNA lysidine(34) synthetase TilS [Candidatus Acidoferrum sp.]|nr:tRNA lysidine(34) synthetase TilS [Candidatus Acidoferrum sp.]
MRRPLEQIVLRYIRDARVFVPGDRVAVAVSGGADSVALLRILENVHAELGITLSVAHFNHQLRGEESERDARFVLDLARARGLELTLDCEDVAAEAQRNGWNLEDGARRLRYGFFRGLVDEGRATRVAVAHTADDQAETVLAHLIRGTGPTGLAGIYPIAGAIVRPLLSVRRWALREYLTDLRQPWCEDSSNADVSRMRARVRTNLLPVLERDFSPGIVDHLCDLARLAREEDVFWSTLVEDRLRACVKAKDGTLAVSIRELVEPLVHSGGVTKATEESMGRASSPQRALTERLIRRLYEEVRGDRRELGSDHVEQVIRLASKSGSGRKVELPGGILVERRFNDLVFGADSARETVSQPAAYHYVVTLPSAGSSTVSVPELGSRFSLKLIDWAGAERETESDQILDAHSLRAPLILRNWRPGDAYTPCGRRQARKLKQMFLAARVPKCRRSEWPVLESAGSVVWARGMPAAKAFCAREGTRVGLVIEENLL